MNKNPMQKLSDLHASLIDCAFTFNGDGATKSSRMEGDIYQKIADEILAILDNPDWVCVPKEATYEMLSAWRIAEGSDEYFSSGEGIGHCYKAMLAAVGEKS